MFLEITEKREGEGKGKFEVHLDGDFMQQSAYDESDTDPRTRRTRSQAREDIIAYFNGAKDGFHRAAGRLRVNTRMPIDIWNELPDRRA